MANKGEVWACEALKSSAAVLGLLEQTASAWAKTDETVTKNSIDDRAIDALIMDAMELAPNIDHIVIFSGDGDFQSLVKSLQRQGVRVSVVSTNRSHPPMIADELRRQADNFIDLEELRDVISQN